MSLFALSEKFYFMPTLLFGIGFLYNYFNSNQRQLLAYTHYLFLLFGFVLGIAFI